jgi:hypothetical protein
MDQNTSLYSYIDPQEERPIYSTALPPFNPVHPDHLPYGTDHTPFPTNLNRKMRLENQVYPLLEVARGDSYMAFSRSLAEDDAAYHIRGNPGREYPYGQSPMFYDSEYPSPPGPPTTDLSSIPETDRSPSPRAVDNYFFPSIQHGHLSHPAIRDLEFVGYGSVAPHEIQHIPGKNSNAIGEKELERSVMTLNSHDWDNKDWTTKFSDQIRLTITLYQIPIIQTQIIRVVNPHKYITSAPVCATPLG